MSSIINQHLGFTCKSCQQLISSTRYKCVQCAEDLCSKCEADNKHNPQHSLLKIPAKIINSQQTGQINQVSETNYNGNKQDDNQQDITKQDANQQDANIKENVDQKVNDIKVKIDDMSCTFILNDKLLPNVYDKSKYERYECHNLAGGWAQGEDEEYYSRSRNVNKPKPSVTRIPNTGKVEAGTIQDSVRLHGLVYAIHEAFARHYELKLKPTDLWTTIIQGISDHINSNPEKYRNVFVDHQDQKQLEVDRNGFVMGSKDNDWAGVFAELSCQIRDNVKTDLPFIITKPFDCSTATTQLVAHVTCMAAMQSYFKYQCNTLCGIPKITLEGSVDDWQELRNRLDYLQLATIDLKEWHHALSFVLDHCLQARKGNPDHRFWNSFYKYKSHSGGDDTNGYYLLLFPDYINKLKGYVDTKQDEWGRKIVFEFPKKWSTDVQLPKEHRYPFKFGMVSTPFVWKVGDIKHQMTLYAGLGDANVDNEKFTSSTTYGWKLVHNTL